MGSTFPFEVAAVVAEMLKKSRNKPLKDRIKTLNITYNAATRKRILEEIYEKADKPIKVWHFHPFDKRPVWEGHDNMDVCVYGKNPWNEVLISDTLVEIFKKHNIK